MTDHDSYTALTEAFGRDLEAAAEARQPRRRTFGIRRPVFAAGGIVAAGALAAALVFAGAFQGGDGLLTPQEAVAAAARDLSSDGVLRLKMVAVDPATGKRLGGARRGYDTWIDLKTGARHDRLLGSPVNKLGGRTASQSWFDGRRSRWAIWGPDPKEPSRRIVMRTIRRSGEAIPDFDNPILELRERLALGAAGKARVEDAGTIGGRPVAKVTETERFGKEGPEDPNPQYTETTTTWITRDPVPRLVRTTTAVDGPRPFTWSQEAEVWDLRPRSADALSHVNPPAFDPQKYIVRTQYLGPRKR